MMETIAGDCTTHTHTHTHTHTNKYTHALLLCAMVSWSAVMLVVVENPRAIACKCELLKCTHVTKSMELSGSMVEWLMLELHVHYYGYGHTLRL